MFQEVLLGDCCNCVVFQEVLVQGDVAREVVAYLSEEFGVPPALIEVGSHGVMRTVLTCLLRGHVAQGRRRQKGEGQKIKHHLCTKLKLSLC